MSTSPQYLSTAQTGERLGISREHVRRLIQRGELRAEETVNGFMVATHEAERFAATRQAQRDQREFRLVVDDLAVKVRHIEGAETLGSVVAAVRNEAKVRSALELPAVVASQMQTINQQVIAEEAFAALHEPVKAVIEQWHRMTNDADRALKNTVDYDNRVKAVQNHFVVAGTEAVEIAGMKAWKEEVQPAAVTHYDERLIDASLVAPTDTEEMARGFVVPEPREARLEEKVDELRRKVNQLTEIVTRQRANTVEIPTWQEWAGSDRPEDVLAKLDAVREEVTSGKRMPENSTDIIRKSREARGQDE